MYSPICFPNFLNEFYSVCQKFKCVIAKLIDVELSVCKYYYTYISKYIVDCSGKTIYHCLIFRADKCPLLRKQLYNAKAIWQCFF